jgi:hypothetical protein
VQVRGVPSAEAGEAVSLHVVERRSPWPQWVPDRMLLSVGRLEFRPVWPVRVEVVDCNAHDGEWPAFITLPHETVEWEGRAVPVFEGDVERRAWMAARAARR